MKYSLNITKQQAEIIIKALDLYSRIGMGQIIEVLDHHTNRIKPEQAIIIYNKLNEIKPMLTGLPTNSYYSISSDQISNNYRIAYDLQQVIRHRLAWDGNPDGGFGVNFDAPMNYSQIPFATIKKIEP